MKNAGKIGLGVIVTVVIIGAICLLLCMKRIPTGYEGVVL